MDHEEHPSITWDSTTGHAAVSYSGDTVDLGMYPNQKHANQAGEQICHLRGWPTGRNDAQ